MPSAIRIRRQENPLFHARVHSTALICCVGCTSRSAESFNRFPRRRLVSKAGWPVQSWAMKTTGAHDKTIEAMVSDTHDESTSRAEIVLTWDTTRLSREMANGTLTAVELITLTLDRIDELNPSLCALVSIQDRTILMKEARKADSSPRKGWLHGIPTAIKDLSNVQGIPSTMGGSPLFADFVPSESDPFVNRLMEAGCIIIGKTNAPESGLGSHTFNQRWGTTRNAYNTDRSAGGSSGGAAVAVSTRMVPFADGSDMMGSLRNPAGWNNVYSMRPTAGMIDAVVVDGNPLSYPISTVGPMARSPRDLGRLLETMSGSDRFRFTANHAQSTATKDMRLAWLGDWDGAFPMERGILELCRGAIDILTKKQGAIIDDLTSQPPMEAQQLWTSWTTIRSNILSESFVSQHGLKTILEAPVRDELLWEVQRGLKISASELDQAEVSANKWSGCVASLFERYDVLALPTAQVWPFPAEDRWPTSIDGVEMDTYHRWMQVVVPCSLAGLPCVTIPAGTGELGLPIGVQLIGPRYSDAKLLSIAESYHALTELPPQSVLPRFSGV